MRAEDLPCMDKTFLRVFDSFEDAEEAELEDWRRMTPAERLEAMTYMQWMVWGDEAVTGNIQRVLEVAERP